MSADRRQLAQIRELRESDGDAVLSAFHSAYERIDPTYRPVSHAFWHWKYFQNPAGVRALIGLDDAGAVIAQYAGLPARICIDGEWTRITQGVDSFSVPDARGLGRRGAFVQTGEAFAKRYGGPCGSGDPWMWGAPIPAARRVGERFLGYRGFRAQPLLVLRRSPRTAATTCVEKAELDLLRQEASGFDALNRRLVESGSVCLERSAHTLAWRYADHPQREYQLLVERSRTGELLGYAILTRGSVRGAYGQLLCELVTANEDESALVNAAWQLACEYGSLALIACLATGDSAFQRYQSLGFHVQGSGLFFVGRSYDRSYPFEYWRESWRMSLGDTDLC